ncbi:hypothetical protein Tco_0670789 [Tanacetum coccineum]
MNSDTEDDIMDPVMQCTTLPSYSSFSQQKLVSFVTEIHTTSIDFLTPNGILFEPNINKLLRRSRSGADVRGTVVDEEWGTDNAQRLGYKWGRGAVIWCMMGAEDRSGAQEPVLEVVGRRVGRDVGVEVWVFCGSGCWCRSKCSGRVLAVLVVRDLYRGDSSRAVWVYEAIWQSAAANTKADGSLKKGFWHRMSKRRKELDRAPWYLESERGLEPKKICLEENLKGFSGVARRAAPSRRLDVRLSSLSFCAQQERAGRFVEESEEWHENDVWVLREREEGRPEVAGGRKGSAGRVEVGSGAEISFQGRSSKSEEVESGKMSAGGEAAPKSGDCCSRRMVEVTGEVVVWVEEGLDGKAVEVGRAMVGVEDNERGGEGRLGEVGDVESEREYTPKERVAIGRDEGEAEIG